MPFAASFLLLIHAGLLAHSATRHSPTLNEPGHLVAGLAHWEFGRFEVYCVNPPLAHYVAAIPVILAGYNDDWKSFADSPGARPEFQLGQRFIRANGERSVWLFTLARWACIPFSLAGALFCFFWSRDLWGSNSSGLISLFLWCFDPNILAHGELITPDCAAASFGLGASYFFWRWLRRPGWGRAVAAAALLGVAELTKTVWVILFGAWPLLWLIWRRCERNRGSGGRSVLSPRPAAQLCFMLLFAVYILNLGYGFDGTFTALKDFRFVSKTMSGHEKPGAVGNRFSGYRLGSLPVPVPKPYLRGLDLQKKDLEDYGQPSYLRGEWRDGGWWYYYLYGFAVKTPHGTQVLLLLAVVVLVCRRRLRYQLSPFDEPDHSGKRPGEASHGHRDNGEMALAQDILVLVLPAGAVLFLVSSQLEFNHHVRYVLPVLGFAFTLAGAAGPAGLHRGAPLSAARSEPEARVSERDPPVRVPSALLVAALLATFGSTLRVYPDQLAYFNELSGGPENGYRHLLHSNLDWGQDLFLVQEWMKQQRLEPDEVRVLSNPLCPARALLLSQSQHDTAAVRWEIVPSTAVFERRSPWRDRIGTSGVERIGHTMWAFPTHSIQQ